MPASRPDRPELAKIGYAVWQHGLQASILECGANKEIRHVSESMSVKGDSQKARRYIDSRFHTV